MANPAWIDRLARDLSAGVAHTFILSLNVSDYVSHGEGVEPYPTLKDYLCTEVFGDRRLVCYYDVSAGLSFGGATEADRTRMEREFRTIVGIPAPEPLPRSPSAVLPSLERVLTADDQFLKDAAGLNPKDFPNGSIAVIIGYAEAVVPAGEVGKLGEGDRVSVVTIARWAGHRQIERLGNTIVLLTLSEVDLSTHLRSGAANVVGIRVSLPNEDDRERFIVHQLATRDGAVLATGVEPRSIARAAAGLPLRGIENIVRLSVLTARPLDEAWVWREKKDVIERMSGGLLEVIRPVWTFDHVGGLDHVKAYLREVAAAIRAGRAVQVPQGILFTGPPGTGKSIMAEALAQTLDFPMVRLRNIQDMWVGASERNLEFALTLIEEFTPVLVFEDEIDQQELKRGTSFHGDSGVSARLMARKMAFLSDTSHRGRILWIAATNRSDLMDQALLRPGRFDTKIPFLLPTQEERPAILAALMRKLSAKAGGDGHAITWSEAERWVVAIADRLDKHSGAEMELILTRAVAFAGRDGRSDIRGEDVEHAVADTLISRDEDEYRYMTILAVRECNSLELLPSFGRNLKQELRTKERMEEFHKLAHVFAGATADVKAEA